MKRMSLFQVILLCVFGASAIAGVLIFSLAIGGGGGSQIGNVTIWGTFDEDAMTEALRNASDYDQRLLTVAYVQKDADTFYSDITNALASGQGPDLVILRDDYAVSQETRMRLLPLADIKENGLSLGISPESFRAVFADAAESFVTPRGILGVPIAIDPLVLYWNRDMLNSNGYSMPPVYWDELYDVAQKMTKRTETGSVTKATIAFGQYRNVNNAKDIMSMLIMQAGGSIVIRNADGLLEPALSNSSSASAQASLAALRFFTEFADPSKQDYTWNASLPEARKAFIAGDLGLYLGFASEHDLIAQGNPNLNFSIAPVPQRRNAQYLVNAGHSYAFAVPRTSKNPNGGRAIAFILAQRDNAKIFSQYLKLPSARRDLLSKETPTSPEPDVQTRQAVIVRTWPDPDPVRTGEIFRGMIEDTVNGSLLLAEAIQRAEQQIAEAVKPYLQQQTQ